MTIQEERAALQKRMDEIDAEIAGFVHGWYLCHDDDEDECRLIFLRDGDENILNSMKEVWLKVEPVTAETLERFLPKPKTLYDWSKAPEWANWAATDKNGSVWWYETEPRASHQKWLGENSYIESTLPSPSVPWEQSLEQRPGITQ